MKTQISAVVLIIRCFFYSVLPIQFFESVVGGIVKREFSYQSITSFGNAFYFLK